MTVRGSRYGSVLTGGGVLQRSAALQRSGQEVGRAYRRSPGPMVTPPSGRVWYACGMTGDAAGEFEPGRSGDRKPATGSTAASNRRVADELPLADRVDHERAERGLLAPAPSQVLAEGGGWPVWDLDAFAFLDGEPPAVGEPQPLAPGAAQPQRRAVRGGARLLPGARPRPRQHHLRRAATPAGSSSTRSPSTETARGRLRPGDRPPRASVRSTRSSTRTATSTTSPACAGVVDRRRRARRAGSR